MRRLGALLIFLAVGPWAQAQTFRGAINGNVADPSGAVVPGARVVGEDVATGVEHTTVTTADGQFAIQDLPLGTYKVTVTLDDTVEYFNLVLGRNLTEQEKKDLVAFLRAL